ncbi:DUF2180 family protein [Sciscionella sediminilitoris]|uniref:DUF2180 family protein n=1 Tax=Sciscionella sediminilitoris TaxID=1445613 RepID=UPI0009EB87EB
MNCFDCAEHGEFKSAVAICTTCGAGVCRDCAHVGVSTIKYPSGFSSAEETFVETRKLACRVCTAALSAHHAQAYRFVPAGESAPV